MHRRSLLLFLLALILSLGCAPAEAADKKKIPTLRERMREGMTLAQASIRTDVHPKDAQIYLDGALVGTVRDYNGSDERLFVFPGEHTLEFRHPGYETYSTQIRVLPEQDLRVRARMKKKN